MMSDKDLSALPKIEKKAISQIMHEHGYSYREMEEYLGADYTTLCKWAGEEISEAAREYAQNLYQKEIEERNKRLLAAVYKRLDELLPKETSISEVIKAGEFSKGRQSQTNQTNVQVNFGDIRAKQKEKYGI